MPKKSKLRSHPSLLSYHYSSSVHICEGLVT